jgi:phosphinothricin acetyltransferase
VGRALLRAVEDHARAQGHHTMIAAISGENTGAIGFHAAQSYAETGRLREVGRKFDRWFDLVVMQKAL